MYGDTKNSEVLNLPVETQANPEYANEIEKAFLAHHELVYRAAFRITGNASDAEDVLQTLFLRLVRREWVPDRQCAWGAYLHRAAINISLDIVRSRARQSALGDNEFMLRETRPDPHREHSSTELRDCLTNALAQLTSSAAEIFVLRYVEGYKVQDIAKMLNTTKSTVAVTLFRTRGRLRKSMRKFHGGA